MSKAPALLNLSIVCPDMPTMLFHKEQDLLLTLLQVGTMHVLPECPCELSLRRFDLMTGIAEYELCWQTNDQHHCLDIKTRLEAEGWLSRN